MFSLHRQQSPGLLLKADIRIWWFVCLCASLVACDVTVIQNCLRIGFKYYYFYYFASSTVDHSDEYPADKRKVKHISERITSKYHTALNTGIKRQINK